MNIADYTRPPTLRVNVRWDYQKLSAEAWIASVGSCFSAELVSELFACGFHGAQNPNGILYNPVSIADALERVTGGPPYTEEEFFLFNELWHSWLHHGSFSAETCGEAVSRCNCAAQQFREVLCRAGILIVTVSSAVVYEEKRSHRIVANCHKVPGTEFSRRLLTAGECRESLKRIVCAFRRCNETAPVLFTLSPVRHYPGDPVLNARSKALLLTAIHGTCESERDCAYFPAYEIVMDELRDYRFYKEDLVHPAPVTVRMIEDCFIANCFESEGMRRLAEGRKRLASSLHQENGRKKCVESPAM